MKRLLPLVIFLVSLFVLCPQAIAGPATTVWDVSGDPYNYSAWGFKGVAGFTWVEDPVVANASQYGYHVSALWMYGQQGYAPNGQPDMAEVGWLKQPSRGVLAPTVYAAWRWPNTYPNTQGDQIFSGLWPAVGSNPWFKIEMQGDGAWHGFYGGTQILWVGNRNSLAAPLAGTERFSTGSSSNGTYHPGDDDRWEFVWEGLNRQASNGAWGNFGNLAEANYAPYGWYMSTDPEFDPWKYNNSRVHNYKARNSGGAGWVRSQSVGYAEAHALNPNQQDYKYFPNADCTNFISQCLNNGGISEDGNWYMHWIGYYYWSLSWTMAHDFYWYFYNTYPRANHFYLIDYYDFHSYDPPNNIPPNKNTRLNNGDIISMDLDHDDILEHSMFVARQYDTDLVTQDYFGDLVDYHTPNTKHQIWHVANGSLPEVWKNKRMWLWGLKSELQ